jgi:hypothetical protein
MSSASRTGPPRRPRARVTFRSAKAVESFPAGNFELLGRLWVGARMVSRRAIAMIPDSSLGLLEPRPPRLRRLASPLPSA